MNIDRQFFRVSLLAIIACELASFLGFLEPAFGRAAFYVLAALGLAATLYRLEYGLWLVLAELFIGSKGYLFSGALGGREISIRLVLWLTVMLVWFGQTVWRLRRAGQVSLYFKELSQSRLAKPYLWLFLFIAWGAVNGLAGSQTAKAVFLDANGWFYFALVLPLWTVLKESAAQARLWSVFVAATVWLAAKTLFLLFIFSHQQADLIYLLYKWVRDSGVGEITQIQGGFYRIFIQSQVYNLLAFFLSLAWLLRRSAAAGRTATRLAFLWLSLNLTVLLLSFSRSFWVAALAGLAVLAWWLEPRPWRLWLKRLANSGLLLLAAGLVSAGLIALVISFPYPRPVGGFDTASLFAQRATQTNEAALGSRWGLLPKIGQAIGAAPVLGQGFGTAVTYYSQDPRVLKANPTGEYTTTAFEWGWLDVWLKLGLFGLLSYLYLLFMIGRADWQQGCPPWPKGALAIGVAVLAAVHAFTPYLNHPLGIGYIIIASVLLARK